MTTIIIIGNQWGDEGKGKVIDLYAQDADAAVRFNGMNNAGHSLLVGEEKVVTHLLPSGILKKDMINICGPYEGQNLEVLVAELEIARKHHAIVYLDESAPIALPIHIMLDKAREEKAGKKKIGTTGSGVGPVFEGLTSRRFVKMGDLRNKKKFREALENSFYTELVAILQNVYGVKAPTIDETINYAWQYAHTVIPYLADTRAIISKLEAMNEYILVEGGQGIMLDLVHGAKPDITASLCGAGGAMATLGLFNVNDVIGVTKAYLTRVGSGPFPTELDNDLGEAIRQKGGEFGATTGRPRRCGWLDLRALKYGCRMGGTTKLFITKADILTGLPKIKVCVDYKIDGITLNRNTTLSAQILKNAEPIYIELPGWKKDISKCRKWSELPKNFKNYIRFIEMYTGINVVGLGVGPERSQSIKL